MASKFRSVTHGTYAPMGTPITHELLVRGHWARHPEWIAGDISALVMRGFPWFHELPVHMYTHSTRRSCRLAHATGISDAPQGPSNHTPELRILPAALAASVTVDARSGGRLVHGTAASGQFLAGVHRGHHTWRVPDCAGLPPTRVRTLQVADALCNFWNWTPSSLADALRPAHIVEPGMAKPNSLRGVAGGIDSRELADFVRINASSGAELPMETVLRLQLKSLVPDLVPQVTITGEGAAFKTAREAKASGHRIVTRADFASLAWRLAFYYDGNHHSGEAQWRKDVHLSLIHI